MPPGIVGTANLRLGDAVAAVLDAHIVAGGGRFRGIRLGATWDASDEVPNHRTKPPQGLFLRRISGPDSPIWRRAS